MSFNSIVLKALAVTVLAVACLSLTYCAGSKQEKILFDFESDTELDHFAWRCHVLFSLSDEHAVRGRRSLRLDLFPADYPGLAPTLAGKDWRGYRTLSFAVYNVQSRVIPLMVRIDDIEKGPPYRDRYNRTFYLKPGANTVEIPANTMITSGTNRKLNLKNICQVLIFLVKPSEEVTLFFDYMRLTT